MPDKPPEPVPSRLFALDDRGQLWPISTVANGQPIGSVINAQSFTASDAPLGEAPSDIVLAFLNALDPAEVERAAMARLGIGDAETGPTRHILDVLKELATP